MPKKKKKKENQLLTFRKLQVDRNLQQNISIGTANP